MGVWHMLESAGFAVCKLASDGLRGAQMTLLGLTYRDVPSRMVRETRPPSSLLAYASGFAFLAQRVDVATAEHHSGSFGRSARSGPLKCPSADKLPKMTNEVPTRDLMRFVKQYKGVWPAPNPAAFAAEGVSSGRRLADDSSGGEGADGAELPTYGGSLDGHYFTFRTGGNPANIIERFEARVAVTNRGKRRLTFYRNGPVGSKTRVDSATASPMETYEIRGNELIGGVNAVITPSGDIKWGRSGFTSRKEESGSGSSSSGGGGGGGASGGGGSACRSYCRRDALSCVRPDCSACEWCNATMHQAIESSRLLHSLDLSGAQSIEATTVIEAPVVTTQARCKSYCRRDAVSCMRPDCNACGWCNATMQTHEMEQIVRKRRRAGAPYPLPRPGCIFPWATNFEPDANVNNYRCVWPEVSPFESGTMMPYLGDWEDASTKSKSTLATLAKTQVKMQKGAKTPPSSLKPSFNIAKGAAKGTQSREWDGSTKPALFVTYALMLRPAKKESLDSGVNAKDACFYHDDLLGCALATWAQVLPASSASLALMLDCDAISQKVLNTSFPGLLAAWLAPVRARVHTRCLHGGVCTQGQAEYGKPIPSPTCYRGTVHLLRWLSSPAFSATDIFVKADADSLVVPAAVEEFLRAVTVVDTSSSTSDLHSEPIVSIHSVGEWEALLTRAESKLVILNAYATGCAPCKTAAPAYAKLREAFSEGSVIFAAVNVYYVRDVAQQLRIREMPTYKVFKNHVELAEQRGWPSGGKMIDLLVHHGAALATTPISAARPRASLLPKHQLLYIGNAHRSYAYSYSSFSRQDKCILSGGSSLEEMKMELRARNITVPPRPLLEDGEEDFDMETRGKQLEALLAAHAANAARTGEGNFSSTGPPSRFQRPCGRTVSVRSTDDWIALEASISGWDVSVAARHEKTRKEAVAYGRGGTYILSKGALDAITRHNCVARVAAVKCSGYGFNGECEHLTQHEDAAVGLCTHLLGAIRMVDIKCITVYPQIMTAGLSCEGTPLSVHPLKKGALYITTAHRLQARLGWSRHEPQQPNVSAAYANAGDVQHFPSVVRDMLAGGK